MTGIEQSDWVNFSDPVIDWESLSYHDCASKTAGVIIRTSSKETRYTNVLDTLGQLGSVNMLTKMIAPKGRSTNSLDVWDGWP
jgi:hypothetical protein